MIPRPVLTLAVGLLAAVGAVGVIGAIGARPAGADTLSLKLDPDRTELGMRLGATLHTVHGTVGHARGEISFDPKTGVAEGQVVIDLTAADTGNERRDEKMHEKILETESFPQAVYQVERIDVPTALHQGENDLQLHGTLTFHGASHPFSVPTVAILDGDRVTASAEFEVPYVDWGLRDPSFFVLRVQKAVTVELRAVGTLRGEVPEAGAEPAAVASSSPSPP